MNIEASGLLEIYGLGGSGEVRLVLEQDIEPSGSKIGLMKYGIQEGWVLWERVNERVCAYTYIYIYIYIFICTSTLPKNAPETVGKESYFSWLGSK